MEDMKELFLDFLQDIYYAEKQGVRGLTKIIKTVSDETLKEALVAHKGMSQGQVERLDEVFGHLGKKPRGKKCAAMDGLLEEANEQLSEAAKGSILDSAMLATCQAIDHYEIARYGALHAWAVAMNMDEAAELLEQTLTEEKESDEQLTEVAMKLNRHAAGTEEEEEEEEEDDEEEDEDDDEAEDGEDDAEEDGEEEDEDDAEEVEPEEVEVEQEPEEVEAEPTPPPARGRRKKA